MNVRVTLSEKQHLILFKLLSDRIDSIYQQEGQTSQIQTLQRIERRMWSAYLIARLNNKKSEK